MLYEHRFLGAKKILVIFDGKIDKIIFATKNESHQTCIAR